MAKKPASKDWHKADIKAAVHKADLTLTALAKRNGYKDPCALGQALHHPWPKAERIIADAIGQRPEVIWPSRYHADGTPRSGRGERGLGRYKNSKRAPDSAINVTRWV